MVTIITTSRYKIDRKNLHQFAVDVLRQLKVPDEADVNIVFIGKRKMRDIALTYKKEDVALPVLAFSYRESMDENNSFLGEIFVCYPQAVLLAAERAKKVEQMMMQLVEHGIRNLLK